MRKLSVYIVFILFNINFGLAQNSEVLADSYFSKGEYNKALVIYKNLSQARPYSLGLVNKLTDTYQQLEQYTKAQELLEQRLKQRQSPTLLIALGYNYQLQDSIIKAQELYNKAILFVDTKPNYIYSIAKKFEDLSLLEQALTVYKKSKDLSPNRNFSPQMARIYGELGQIDNMFNSYLDYVAYNPSYLNNIKRAINPFISEDNTNTNNSTLRRLLFKKIQAEPLAYLYDMLSWLYVQERAYKKSFVQEKALYKRNPESLDRIIELGITALDDKDTETATHIFEFVTQTSQDASTQLKAQQYLLDIETQNANQNELKSIQQKYLELFETYGKTELTLSLQLAYAKFLAFHLKDSTTAISFLKASLQQSLTKFQVGSVKMLLADVLVLQERFNEALIYYSQVQVNLKNSALAQEARFKVAKTSYYKGDFNWAESQLNILKSSTSQLIANDALDLKLLISDNKYEDSTQTALKLYAKADLLAFQNKNLEAITLLDNVLKDHKGETITDQALYKQAKLFEAQKQYTKAEANYLQIISDYKNDILIDDAYYYLAELYNTILNKPEEAKPLYESIIFNHEDSIYFVEARKKYRILRGDDVN